MLKMPEDKDAQRQAGEDRRVARAMAEDAVLAAYTSKLDVPLIGDAKRVTLSNDVPLVQSMEDGLGFVVYKATEDDNSREWAMTQAIEAANAEMPLSDHVVTLTLVTNIWKIDQLAAAMGHTFDHECDYGQMLLNELSVAVISQLIELGEQLITDWRSGDGGAEAEGED